MALERFIWDGIPEMYSCGAQTVTWVCQGIPSTAQVSISITDASVEQLAPLSSSTTDTTTPSSTVTGDTQILPSPTETVTGITRRSPYRRQKFGNWNGFGGSWLPIITEELVSNLDPTSQNWTWPSVNVTQGWYVLTATAPAAAISTSSAPFFVSNGTTTFPCLGPSAPSSTSSASVPPPTSTASSSTVVVTPSAGNDTGSSGASSSSRLNTGAIAGGVVGGVAFLAAVIAAMLFFLCRRKRNLRARSAVGPGVPPKKKRRAGERSESMQALPTKAHASRSSSFASVAAAGPISEEGLTMRENNAAGAPVYTPASAASRRFSTQSAMGYQPSAPYEGYNMAPLRSTSQPGAAREATAPTALTIPPSDEMLGSSAPASAARRKPVPKYDVEEFGEDANTSSESGSAEASSPLKHAGSYGNMKPMQHVIQPDLPADRQV